VALRVRYAAAQGKTILLDKKKPFVVSGVADNVPSNSSIEFDFVLSYEFCKEVNPNFKSISLGYFLFLRASLKIVSSSQDKFFCYLSYSGILDDYFV
jgi:hypothetical protein